MIYFCEKKFSSIAAIKTRYRTCLQKQNKNSPCFRTSSEQKNIGINFKQTRIQSMLDRNTVCTKSRQLVVRVLPVVLDKILLVRKKF